MNLKAKAETYADLWYHIDNYLKAKYPDDDNDLKVNAIFDRLTHYEIHKEIGSERGSVPHEDKIDDSGPPSDRQIQYAKDLGCFNPEQMTKKEISKWIDEHK